MRRIVRLWFSPRGAEQGFPWLVQYDDGETSRMKDLVISGTFEGRYQPEGEKSLYPDPPRAYLERKLDEQWKDSLVFERQTED